jgi:hypothetical protein
MTSHIYESTSVGCSPGRAKRCLAEYFERRRDATGMIRLKLRVSREYAGEELFEAEVDVDALIFEVPPGDALEKLYVQWAPSGGPFPHFQGTLVAEPGESGASFTLALEGSYEPPFGALGAAFDHVAGRKIAIASAHRLLGDIAAGIEADAKAASAGQR